MQTTTDLDIIRRSPRRFTWGDVVKIHDVGAYTIVEATTRGGTDVSFHVYVDGRDCCVGAASLDGALILAIARKHLGATEASHMAIAAAKVLGVT